MRPFTGLLYSLAENLVFGACAAMNFFHASELFNEGEIVLADCDLEAIFWAATTIANTRLIVTPSPRHERISMAARFMRYDVRRPSRPVGPPPDCLA